MVRRGSSPETSETYPTRSRVWLDARRVSSPKIVISPELGRSSPIKHFNAVVLPAPFRPSSAVMDASRTDQSALAARPRWESSSRPDRIEPLGTGSSGPSFLDRGRVVSQARETTVTVPGPLGEHATKLGVDQLTGLCRAEPEAVDLGDRVLQVLPSSPAPLGQRKPDAFTASFAQDQPPARDNTSDTGQRFDAKYSAIIR